MTWQVDVGGRRREGAVTRFTVRVDGGVHDVGVSDEDAAAFGGGDDVQRLVRESFCFLLEREPPEAIMRRFDLPVIARYFPEYPGDIRRRMRR